MDETDIKKKGNKTTYTGNHLVNSRVFVDYTKGKPEARFEYPEKKGEFSFFCSSLPVLILSGAITLFIFMLIIFFAFKFLPETAHPVNCSMNVIDGVLSIKGIGTAYTATCIYTDGTRYTNHFQYNVATNYLFFKTPGYFTDVTTDAIFAKSASGALLSLISAALFFGIWFMVFGILYFFAKNTKAGNVAYPKINRLGTKGYHAKITECPADKIIELPLFKNVRLRYKAEGEFSDYLERVEITEHPFDRLVTTSKDKKKGAKIDMGVNMLGQNEPYEEKAIIKTGKNVWLWRARFFFKEVPKEGSLDLFWI